MKIILALLVTVLSASAFAVSPGDLPLENFIQVDTGLYRSAAPAGAQVINQLAQAGIKTIIDLQQNREKDYYEEANATEAGIRYIARPMTSNRRNTTPYVRSILKLVADKSSWPLLVHCKHGEDRTGLIIGLYRVVYQGWKPQDAWNEMLELGYHRFFYNLTAVFEEVTGFDP